MPAELMRLVGQQLGGPLLDEVRRKRAARNEPRAVLERQRRTSSRSLGFLLVVVAIFAVIGALALIGTPIAVATVVVAAFGVAVPGVLAARCAGQIHRVNKRLAVTPRTRARAAEPRYRLPPLGSKARQPLQRLAAAEMALSELLEQLLPVSGVAAVPPDAISHARTTADDAAEELRRLAGQLRSLERAREAAGSGERGALGGAVEGLQARLDEGVDAYGRLVSAAGQTVAASASPISREHLTDATEHLAGLAAALSELPSPNQG